MVDVSKSELLVAIRHWLRVATGDTLGSMVSAAAIHDLTRRGSFIVGCHDPWALRMRVDVLVPKAFEEQDAWYPVDCCAALTVVPSGARGASVGLTRMVFPKETLLLERIACLRLSYAGTDPMLHWHHLLLRDSAPERQTVKETPMTEDQVGTWHYTLHFQDFELVSDLVSAKPNLVKSVT